MVIQYVALHEVHAWCCVADHLSFFLQERLNSLHLAASAGHLDIVRDLVDKYHMNIAATTKVCSSCTCLQEFLSVNYFESIEEQSQGLL